MTEQRAHTPHRVVIGGGGVAALEALIALHHLAGDRVDMTVVAPSDEFVVRALSVVEPFGQPGSRAYDIEQACADHGARFVLDAIHTVQPHHRTVMTRNGALIPYDSLLLALGARPVPAFEHILTFRGPYDADAMHSLLRDIDAGAASSVAFVVPDGTTWPLPLYELALMTAERAAQAGREVALAIVTPEPRPLALFGGGASAEVERLLTEHGITLHPSCHVRAVEDGVVRGTPGDVEVHADRVVAVPVLYGPRLHGLPHDDHGFLPVDDHGRVVGVDGVFGAGDGTTIAIKQGGVAAQQAGAAARAIARRAGVDVEEKSFRPSLRARLMTGSGSVWLREEPAGGAGDQASAAGEEALWWPPTKVAAPYLVPYLDRIDRGESGPVPEVTRPPQGASDGIEVLF
jgi:sulfide:quinone oxidoreductase